MLPIMQYTNKLYKIVIKYTSEQNHVPDQWCG